MVDRLWPTFVAVAPGISARLTRERWRCSVAQYVPYRISVRLAILADSRGVANPLKAGAFAAPCSSSTTVYSRLQGVAESYTSSITSSEGRSIFTFCKTQKKRGAPSRLSSECEGKTAPNQTGAERRRSGQSVSRALAGRTQLLFRGVLDFTTLVNGLKNSARLSDIAARTVASVSTVTPLSPLSSRPM